MPSNTRVYRFPLMIKEKTLFSGHQEVHNVCEIVDERCAVQYLTYIYTRTALLMI